MNLYWIKEGKFQIAIMARPRGSDSLPDDIAFGFPIEDRPVPETSPDFDAFIEILNTEPQAGLPIAIHCRAGIGRSSLIAACLSTRQGVHADDAIASIEAAQGCLIPDTPEQRTWIKKFGCRKQSELQSWPELVAFPTTIDAGSAYRREKGAGVADE
jgi:hypothetical protein